MAAEEISKIFHEVLTNNLQYCAVCLRTGSKLVESETFVLCTKKLRQRVPINTMLCVMCDSQMKRTWRTMHAIMFAVSISTWYQVVSARLKRATAMEIQQNFTRFTMLSTFGDNKPLDEYWRVLRAATNMAQTETLVISSEPSPPPTQEKTEMCKEEVIVPDLPASPVLSISPPPSEYPPLGSCSPKIENVVVIDDDDPIPTSTVPVQKHLEANKSDNNVKRPADNVQHMLAINSNEPNKYVLYPIIQGNDKMYLPMCQCAKCVNKNCKVHQKTRQQATNIIEYNNDDNEMKVFENKHIINSVIDNEMKAFENKDIIDFTKANEGDSGGNLEDIVVNVAGSGGSLGEKETQVAKAAVMSGKVDWEDKIPMDVISFVDATDPNAQEFLHPDPIVPSVKPRRSRQTKPPPINKRPRSDLVYKESAVIIDLC